MNQKEKIEYRIKGLQRKMELTALLQRNYQRHYHKNSEKHDRNMELYMQLTNDLRNELHAIQATEPTKTESDKNSFGPNVVAVGESIVIIG